MSDMDRMLAADIADNLAAELKQADLIQGSDEAEVMKVIFRHLKKALTQERTDAGSIA